MAEYVNDELKRLIDVLAAAVLIVLLLPVLVVIACLVRLSGPGPIIYRGLRVGRDGRPFRILKFRSMSMEGPPGGEITVHHDPRVTEIGRVLRATKLDELPQLINVLRGEMSFVGPRPESPRYLDHYTQEQREILRVRPGITGTSQVAFRSEEELLDTPDPEQYYVSTLLPAKLAMDLAYVHRHTLLGDFKIILLTLLTLVRPINSLIPVPAYEVSPLNSVTTAGDMRQTERFRGSAWQWVDRVIIRRVRSYSVPVILDALTVTIAFEAAVVLRFLDSGHMYREARAFLLPSIAMGIVYAVASYGWGLHRRLWRYASIQDGLALGRAVAVTMLIVIGADVLDSSSNIWARSWYAILMSLARTQGINLPQLPHERVLPLGVVIGGALLSFLFLGCVKLVPRATVAVSHANPQRPTTRVLLVGAGQAGATFASRMAINGAQGYRVVACVDDDPAKWGRKIHGVPVVGSVNGIPHFVTRYDIDLIAIALPSVPAERLSEIIAICQQTAAMIKRVPGLQELVAHGNPIADLRDLNVADLLGREVVPLHFDRARSVLEGRAVLVTGAAGSIGSELCRQLLEYAPARVIALDSNETGLFDLAEQLHLHPHIDKLIPWIADVMDEHAISHMFAEQRPTVVFHAAAYKHVPLLERHPYQAVRTNVLGTYELCRMARKFGVSRFVFVSTDKAANPVNTYGASKTLGEIIVRTMARAPKCSTLYCAVRFGNVIGSRGSVVPIFTRQIEREEAVTVTDPTATRYFMTIPEACGLVIATCALADQGDLFILDMGEPVRIAVLAEKMIRSRGLRVGDDIPIVYTGLRPGERLHEMLVADAETLLPTEHEKIYHVEHRGLLDTPSDKTLQTWMRDLRQCIENGDMEHLREHVLEMAGAQADSLSV